jgi:hypothetical protein
MRIFVLILPAQQLIADVLVSLLAAAGLPTGALPLRSNAALVRATRADAALCYHVARPALRSQIVCIADVTARLVTSQRVVRLSD